MKKAVLLIVLFISIGFVSQTLDGVEFGCHYDVTAGSLIGELGWKLWDALL